MRTALPLYRLLLLAALAAGATGCFHLFGAKRPEPPRPWAITLMAGDTTNAIPRQEWMVIENELLGSERFQRFVETARRGSLWMAPVGARTYRWQIHDYDPVERQVTVKRFLGE